MTEISTTATIDAAKPATIEDKALAAGMKKVKTSPSTKAFRGAVVGVVQGHVPKKAKPDVAIAILADMIGTLIPLLPSSLGEPDVLNLVNVNVRRGFAKTQKEIGKAANLGG